MTSAIEWSLLSLYALTMLLIAVYSLSLLELARTTSSKKRQKPVRTADEWPRVLIQLPIYNERYVVRELLLAVARLDYPRDRLSLQILDDSTDDTSAIVEESLSEPRALGLRVDHVRRANRRGFKGGALAAGLENAHESFVAIFDADFRPPSDFLTRTVPLFAEDRVACVQVRWDHVNEDSCLLTRAAATFLSLHFGYEQPRRSAHGCFLNFNGTCGVWRVQAIRDAGGWKSRTLTEDLDLSYRAQLRGWQIVYLNGYTCPGELPPEIDGFRAQQYRWLKGGAQNARIHLPKLVRSSLPGRVKWHACHHLLAGALFPLVLFLLLLSTPLAVVKNTHIQADYADYGSVFLLSTLGISVVFWLAQPTRTIGLRSSASFLVRMAYTMVLSMGLSFHLTRAVISGWFNRPSDFVRTPKFGSLTPSRTKYSSRRLDLWILAEGLLAVYLLLGLLLGWGRKEFSFFPLQLMGLVGFLWVLVLQFWTFARSRYLKPTPAEPTAVPPQA